MKAWTAGWPASKKFSIKVIWLLLLACLSCFWFCFLGGRQFIDSVDVPQCRRSVPAGGWMKFNIHNLSSGLHLWRAQCEGYEIKRQSQFISDCHPVRQEEGTPSYVEFSSEHDTNVETAFIPWAYCFCLQLFDLLDAFLFFFNETACPT